jgi:CRISPR-associated exonuclease Cas4
MYSDEELIPISALQHHLFCPRQCALIHVDGLWAENHLTAHGKMLHERSDRPGSQQRRTPTRSWDAPRSEQQTKRIVRAMPLLSRRLGLTGKADQVEIIGPAGDEPAIRPVEHKRGKPKRLDHDRVQLAAQAMCLEEMFGVSIAEGDLFYHAVRRRETVPLTDRLRYTVERVTEEVRRNITENITPRADRKPKCRNCSLFNLCLPDGTAPARDPSRYLARSLGTSLRSTPAPPSAGKTEHTGP